MAYARPFPVNNILTALAIGYRNPAGYYIQDEVMPRQPVPAEKFSWMQYPIGQAFTVPPTEVGRLGRVSRVEFSGTMATASVRDFALEDAIPITDIDAAAAMEAAGQGNFRPLDTATETLSDLLLVDREVRVAGIVQNPNSYAGNHRLILSGQDQFSDYVNSDPLTVIKACLSVPLVFRPNTAVMSRLGWDILSSHPKLVSAVKNGFYGEGIITPDDFAKLFGFDKVLIGQGYANVARPGQLPNLQRIWGTSIELLYLNPAARPENGMTWGMTACYGSKFATDWFDKDVGIQGAQVLRVGERVVEIVTAPDVGFMIQNAIAG